MNDRLEPFLLVREVAHHYPGRPNIIADISLTIPAGSFTVLVGPSGVGKSTLLRILAGLIQPTAGQVSHYRPNGHPIGIVFQRDNLMPWRTVYENIRLPLELQANGESSGRVNQLIQMVGLAGFEHSYPAQLSGGMAQRVALARALVHRPGLLLLDEPFGALDALTRERMGQELLALWEAMPVTVFMVTHSINEAVLLADQILVMKGSPGRISHQIPISLARPRHLAMEATPNFQNYVATIRAAIQTE